MSLAWPIALIALLVAPAVLAAGWLLLRRRRRSAVRVASIALVRTAVPERSRWTRRVPPILLTLAIVVLAVGAARPQVPVPVASDDTTIILAFDVSSSMCTTDVDPNRLAVAKEAAIAFVEEQAGARIGLVAFSGTAGLVVSPTDDTDALVDAIDALTTSRGTAIGQAILVSIDAIAEIDSSVASTGVDVEATEGDADAAAAAVVVLTDGANSQGVDPVTAAAEAAARGVRVYTIGFGTDTAAASVCDTSQVSGFDSSSFGGGATGGSGLDQSIDEDTLAEVAETTGGEYYRAENADQLGSALSDLPSSISVVEEDLDVAAWFAAGGGLLAATALGLSLWWSRPGSRPASRVASRSGGSRG